MIPLRTIPREEFTIRSRIASAMASQSRKKKDAQFGPIFCDLRYGVDRKL